MKNTLQNCIMCAEGLGQFHAGSLVGGQLSLYEPKVCRLIDSSVVFICLFALLCFCGVSCSSSSPSSTGFPELCIMLGCGLCICFSQFLGEASLMMVRLGSCLQI